MRRHLIWFLVFSVILTACATKPSVPAEKFCESDADCVPAQCCHPDDAVNKDYAPDCSEVFCTMECRPGTIDCGQGEIRCVEKECQAVLF